jgi:hypothetical protein
VHRFEEDLFMDAEGNFFANKEEKGESQSAGAAKGEREEPAGLKRPRPARRRRF